MLLEVKIALLAILAVGLFGAGVFVTRDHYLTQIKTIENNYLVASNKAQNDLIAEQSAHQADLIKGENQHAQDQSSIASLAFQLAGVQHVSGICSSAAAKADSSRKSANKASRVLPNRVDVAFAKLQDGVGKLIEQCDQLNIDARQLNVQVGNAP